MKRKFSLIILIITLLLAIVSCDRFEKPTKIDNIEEIDYSTIVDSLFSDFNSVADTTSADNTEYFMNFFHADYLNNGQTKQDIEALVNGIFLVYEPRFISVELINENGYQLINNEIDVEWNLIVSTTDEVIVDSINFVDKLLKVEKDYYFYGNQVEPVDEEKLRPFAEILTATWCPTCPSVESAMHDYLELNPDNFFYLEFHGVNSIPSEHEFFDNFYGQSSPPVAILQGKDMYSGDQSELYPEELDSFQEMYAQLKLNNLIQTANSENYQAQVDIDKLSYEEFDTTNLKLRWAFYEEVSAVNNYVGQPCRNVVLTEGYFDITSEDLGSTFAINIDYPREIPDDMGIVFWLQTAGDTYSPDDSFIHGWIKQDLGGK